MHEEMGILVQEVVGRRIGPYFLPAFSGVGFSQQRVPLVGAHPARGRPAAPGARASARARSTVWPTTTRCWSRPASPGCASTRPPTRSLRYSPKKLDVINLERGTFETIDVARPSCAEHGEELPGAAPDAVDRRGRHAAPAARPDRLRERDDLVVTFEGLVSETPFIAAHAGAARGAARAGSRPPVDIEFAYDGEDVYLLQCRPQGATRGDAPVRDPARPAARADPVHRAAATSRTARCGDITPRRLRRSRGLQPARARRAARRRPRGRPAESTAAQAPVHPDGPGPLGQPRRHPAGRAASPTPTSATPRC